MVRWIRDRRVLSRKVIVQITEFRMLNKVVWSEKQYLFNFKLKDMPKISPVLGILPMHYTSDMIYYLHTKKNATRPEIRNCYIGKIRLPKKCFAPP